jgi:hypothetical protein
MIKPRIILGQNKYDEGKKTNSHRILVGKPEGER